MAQTPKKPQPSSPTGGQKAPLTRRGQARWQRERRRQRLVMIAGGVAIGLALLAVLGGVLFEQVWKPSRPVARVNNVSLSAGDYWTERRSQIARNIAQNLQLLAMFGGQFGDQFSGQIPSLDTQVPGIKTAPVDEATVNGWIDRQIILQGAAEKYNVQASDGEIAQQLLVQLAGIFPPPPPPVTSTATLTSTATVSGTATAPNELTPIATSTNRLTPIATLPVSGTTATPSGPTATPAPTETPVPTETPTVTPPAETALVEQNDVIGRLYDAYIREMQAGRPNLTIDDFKAAMRDQYLQEVVTNKVKEQLVPEASFQPSTEPSSISTRHILLKITAPITATDAEREAAYAARKADADAILTQLRDGADFATLAREKSEDLTTKDSGGDLPAFDKEGKTPEGSQFDPAFVAAALALQENGISDLVRTPFGWHIIQVTKRTVDSKADQLQAERTTRFEEWLTAQRAAVTVEHFPPVSPTPTPPPTGTALPLPTQPLGGQPTEIPTPTLPVTGTATLPLTGTTTLPTSTVTVTGTTVQPTTATVQPTGTTPSALPATAAPTAVLPTRTPTPTP